jgi:hypothetical protein
VKLSEISFRNALISQERERTVVRRPASLKLKKRFTIHPLWRTPTHCIIHSSRRRKFSLRVSVISLTIVSVWPKATKYNTTPWNAFRGKRAGSVDVIWPWFQRLFFTQVDLNNLSGTINPDLTATHTELEAWVVAYDANYFIKAHSVMSVVLRQRTKLVRGGTDIRGMPSRSVPRRRQQKTR